MKKLSKILQKRPIKILRKFFNSPAFRKDIKEHVDSVNKDFPEKERVKKYKVLDAPFSEEDGDVTANRKKPNKEKIKKKHGKHLSKLTQDPLNFLWTPDFTFLLSPAFGVKAWPNDPELQNLSEEELEDIKEEKLGEVMGLIDNIKKVLTSKKLNRTKK